MFSNSKNQKEEMGRIATEIFIKGEKRLTESFEANMTSFMKKRVSSKEEELKNKLHKEETTYYYKRGKGLLTEEEELCHMLIIEGLNKDLKNLELWKTLF